MKYIAENKGNIIITLLAIIAGVALGIAVYGAFHEAQAVLGETGNVTGINNPHNLSAGSAGIEASVEKRVCIFCHTAHHAVTDSTLINAPLWNHSLSSQTYQVKTSGTVVNALDAYGSTVIGVVNMLSSPGAPDGASRLCLSCHDGTVGIGNVSSEASAIAMAADACLDAEGKLLSSCAAYIGNDLTQKHVVSIPMNDELISSSVANCGLAGQTFQLAYPFSNATQADVVLLRPTLQTYSSNPGVGAGKAGMTAKYKTGYSYGVQCSTCHDPHQWVDTGGDMQQAGYKFLVTGFDDLCQACHIPCP